MSCSQIRNHAKIQKSGNFLGKKNQQTNNMEDFDGHLTLWGRMRVNSPSIRTDSVLSLSNFALLAAFASSVIYIDAFCQDLV